MDLSANKLGGACVIVLCDASFHSARSFSPSRKPQQDPTLHGRIMRSRSKHFPVSATLLSMWPFLCVPPILCVVSFPLELLFFVLTCQCRRRADREETNCVGGASTPLTLSTACSPTPPPPLASDYDFEPPNAAMMPLSSLMPECSPP